MHEQSKPNILKRWGQHVEPLREGLAPQRSRKNDPTMNQMAHYGEKNPNPNNVSNIVMIKTSNSI
jgi:hypothetical protein